MVVANPDYFKGRPPISRIVYRIIPSQATIFLEVKAMGVDVASLTALQYTRQTEYPAFEKAYNKYRYPASGLHLLRLQPEGSALRRPPRAPGLRPRHQQARPARRRASSGLGAEATGPFRPGTLGEQPRRQGRSLRSHEGAPRLLAEAGWKTQRRGAAGEGRQAVHLRAADEPGQRRAQEGRRDHPGLAARDGHRRGHPHPRVGRAAQGAHQEAQLPGHRAGLGDRLRSRPVRRLALLPDRARRAEPHLLREPRGGRAARRPAAPRARRPNG